MSARRHSWAIASLLLAGLACTSAVEPRTGVTLLVTNGTCASGRCDALEVLAFPSDQPLTPGGYWSLDLGLLTLPQACFTFPPSATARVIGLHADGTADTVTYTWTPAKSLALGVQTPSSSRIQASPSTAPFVPALAAGWRLTLPTDSLAIPAPACAP